MRNEPEAPHREPSEGAAPDPPSDLRDAEATAVPGLAGGGLTDRAILELRRSLEEPPPDVQESAQGVGERREDEDPGVAEELKRIARRVRHWREEKRFTLQELARRSGVAASTIQKVETQQMVPTVAVLLKISRGLDRAPSELVQETSDDLLAVHLHRAERHAVGIREHMLCERLVGDLFEPTLEAWRLTLQPGAGSGPGRIRHDGESLVLGESGAVTFRLGDRDYVVREGDILHFKCTLPHSWRNDGSEPASLLTIGTLPKEVRRSLHERMRAGSDGDGKGGDNRGGNGASRPDR